MADAVKKNNGEMKTNDLVKKIDNAKQSGEFTLLFNKPISYEKYTYNSLHFDFGSLTGVDFEAIEEEMAQHGKIVISARLSGEFLRIMCVKACKEQVNSDFIRALPIKKYEQLRNAARNFFNTPD